MSELIYLDHAATTPVRPEVAEAMCDQIGIIQHGRIVAHGTMAQIRHQHAAGDASLEELFLKLTGGHAVRELVEVLGK